ncbi:hypothetical protein GCM10027614_03930 [Micromonospora vulcania]
MTRVEAARGELARVVPYRRVDDVTLVRGGELLGDPVSDGESGYPTSDLDLTALPSTDDLDVAHGTLAERGPGRIVLGGWVARRTGLGVGDTAALARAGRTVDVRVVAVLPDNGPLNTGILTDSADLDRLGAPAAYKGLLADASRSGRMAVPPPCGRCDRRSGTATGWASRSSPTSGTATTRCWARCSGSPSAWSA